MCVCVCVRVCVTSCLLGVELTGGGQTLSVTDRPGGFTPTWTPLSLCVTFYCIMSKSYFRCSNIKMYPGFSFFHSVKAFLTSPLWNVPNIQTCLITLEENNSLLLFMHWLRSKWLHCHWWDFHCVTWGSSCIESPTAEKQQEVFAVRETLPVQPVKDHVFCAKYRTFITFFWSRSYIFFQIYHKNKHNLNEE